MNTPKNIHNFYIIQNNDGKYFAGFNTASIQSEFVDDPLEAKMYTNKNTTKIRPSEMLVEIFVEFSKANTAITSPFRPRLATRKLAA